MAFIFKDKYGNQLAVSSENIDAKLEDGKTFTEFVQEVNQKLESGEIGSGATGATGVTSK